MANKEKKGFKAGAYAVIAGVVVAVILVALTIFAFTTRYTAFSPEKTAQYYADVVVQNADGYNAYKNTLVSKNQKFGDFVVNAYMAPYINDGDDVKKNEEIGSGSKKEGEMLDQIYSTMYDYYVELVEFNGMDNYDVVFSQYFAKLKEVRTQILADDYMDTEFMFGVFESNVEQYGKALTGTEVEYEADGETVKTEATIGKYQEKFGENYKLVTTVKSTNAVEDKDAYIASYKERITPVAAAGEAKAKEFGLDGDRKDAMVNAYNNLDCSDSIEDVAQCEVSVALEDGTEVASTTIYVVKIGNSWYVDNTNVDTSSLYLASLYLK